jgi:predicted Zn-dependent protease
MLPSTGSTGVETCNGTGRSSSYSVSVFMANTLFVSGEKELVISDYSLEAL